MRKDPKYRSCSVDLDSGIDLKSTKSASFLLIEYTMDFPAWKRDRLVPILEIVNLPDADVGSIPTPLATTCISEIKHGTVVLHK